MDSAKVNDEWIYLIECIFPFSSLGIVQKRYDVHTLKKLPIPESLKVWRPESLKAWKPEILENIEE